MKKMDKNYLWLILIGLVLVGLIVPKGSLFGSLVDWLPQHIMFPDYFRKLFYETGHLFPNFSMALGAGQNIFNFSYYGLFNPVILLSYLLPFVSMTNYLIGANIVLYISTGIFCYMFLKRHFTKQISLISSIILLLASPLLFHFHRHFMFVSYMPFVFLGLISIESYFEKGKKWPLALCTFIIILMSYYYSIPSILVFVLYGIYCYIKKEKNITAWQFIKDGFVFLLPILLGIVMAAFLLLPTFYTLLEGRSTGDSPSFFSLFIPDLDLSNILYNNYAIGLSALAVISILYAFMSQKKEMKFLSVATFVILLFPIFSYLLNGTLYIRDKVFIPFLPLFIFFIASFLKDLSEKKLSKLFYPVIIFCNIWILLLGSPLVVYYIDLLLTLFFIYMYEKKDWSMKTLWFFILAPLVTCLAVNTGESYVKKDVYQKAIPTSKEIETVLQKENDFVRTYHLEESLYNVNKIYTNHYYTDAVYSSIYNNEYRTFYKDVFKNPLSYRNKLITASNNNLLYQMFMGGKYIYANTDMIGYQKVSDHMYQNADVLPVFYVTNHIMSEKDFTSLEYPYNAETLLKNVIVGDTSQNVLGTQVKEASLKGHITSQKGLQLEKKNHMYIIEAKEKNALEIELDASLQNKILLLEFTLGKEWNCKDGDSKIVINQVANTLTCKSWMYKNQNQTFHYVLADNDMKNLHITFKKGHYEIKNMRLYTMEYADIKDIRKNVTEATVEKKKTSGDKYVVNVQAKEKGYFVSSIPYDDGFTIYDNGKKIAYEKVNTAFIGFPIEKGKHEIVMQYEAPLFKEGKIMSAIGFVLFIILIIFSKKSSKIKYHIFI